MGFLLFMPSSFEMGWFLFFSGVCVFVRLSLSVCLFVCFCLLVIFVVCMCIGVTVVMCV